jgi:hypothetical protein
MANTTVLVAIIAQAVFLYFHASSVDIHSSPQHSILILRQKGAIFPKPSLMARNEVKSKTPTAPKSTADLLHPPIPASSEVLHMGSIVQRNILADLKANWGTDDMRDMIADKSWLKGIDTNTVTFELDTLAALRDLSEMSKGNEDFIKKELKKKWSDRDKDHKNRDRPWESVRLGVIGRLSRRI